MCKKKVGKLDLHLHSCSFWLLCDHRISSSPWIQLSKTRSKFCWPTYSRISCTPMFFINNLPDWNCSIKIWRQPSNVNMKVSNPINIDNPMKAGIWQLGWMAKWQRLVEWQGNLCRHGGSLASPDEGKEFELILASALPFTYSPFWGYKITLHTCLPSQQLANKFCKVCVWWIRYA